MTSVSVDDVCALYGRWGSHRYDEELTQVAHAEQTAALAAAAGASDFLVAASLLHDVGHLLELDATAGATAGAEAAEADLRHEARGARYLAGLFPSSVTGAIALHVPAKRYRCAIDPPYRERLSAGSTRSLIRQGGPMDDAAARRFERHPQFADAVRLRGWDDEGKVDGLDVAPFDAYRDLLERVSTAS